MVQRRSDTVALESSLVEEQEQKDLRPTKESSETLSEYDHIEDVTDKEEWAGIQIIGFHPKGALKRKKEPSDVA